MSRILIDRGAAAYSALAQRIENISKRMDARLAEMERQLADNQAMIAKANLPSPDTFETAELHSAHPTQIAKYRAEEAAFKRRGPGRPPKERE